MQTNQLLCLSECQRRVPSLPDLQNAGSEMPCDPVGNCTDASISFCWVRCASLKSKLITLLYTMQIEESRLTVAVLLICIAGYIMTNKQNVAEDGKISRLDEF